MYASDYLDDQDDTDYYTYLYDGASEYYYFYETWSEDSFCAEVLDDMSYHFSSFFDDSTYSTSTSSTASPSSSSPSSMYSSLSFSGGFHKDTVNGHGTWTAGSAAGSISTGAGVAGAECYGDELPGCAGGCIAGSTINENLGDGMFDLDLFCPTYECDGEGFSYSYCLGDDPVETLRQHGGVAPGAQIAVFDASYTADGGFFVAEFGGNLVWESAIGTGAKIHSNSWGFHTFCQLTENDFLYDTFMYEVSHSGNKSSSEPTCPNILYFCPNLFYEDHGAGSIVRRRSLQIDISTRLCLSSNNQATCHPTIQRHLPFPVPVSLYFTSRTLTTSSSLRRETAAGTRVSPRGSPARCGLLPLARTS